MTTRTRARVLARARPLALIAILAVAWWRLDMDRFLRWDAIARNEAMLTRAVAHHPVEAALLYTLAYAAMVGLSIPVGAVLTVTGGMLFGRWAGAGLATVGATGGAIIVFLIARHAAAGFVARHGGPRMDRLRAHLAHDGFGYLLALRLLPIVPFWLSNLAPALAGMPLSTYALATVLGIGPVTFVLASIGEGARPIILAGGEPDLSRLASPELLLPLAALAVLSLLPTLLAPALRRRRLARG